MATEWASSTTVTTVLLYIAGLKLYDRNLTVHRRLARLRKLTLLPFILLILGLTLNLVFEIGGPQFLRQSWGAIVYDWNFLLATLGYAYPLKEGCFRVPGGIAEKFPERLTLPGYQYNRRCVGTQDGTMAQSKPLLNLSKNFSWDILVLGFLVERLIRSFFDFYVLKWVHAVLRSVCEVGARTWTETVSSTREELRHQRRNKGIIRQLEAENAARGGTPLAGNDLEISDGRPNAADHAQLLDQMQVLQDQEVVSAETRRKQKAASDAIVSAQEDKLSAMRDARLNDHDTMTRLKAEIAELSCRSSVYESDEEAGDSGFDQDDGEPRKPRQRPDSLGLAHNERTGMLKQIKTMEDQSLILRELLDEQSRTSNTTIACLEDEANTMREKIREREKVIVDLREQLDESKRHRITRCPQENLTSKEDDIDTDALDSTRSRTDAGENLQVKIRELRRKKAELAEEVVQLQEDAQDSAARIQELKEQVTNLPILLEQISRDTTTIGDLRRKLAAYKNTSSEIKQAKQNHEKDLKEAVKIGETLQAKVAHLKSRITRLELDNARQAQRLREEQDHKAHADKAYQQLDGTRRANVAFKKVIENRQGTISELRLELSAASEIIADQRTLIDKLEDEQTTPTQADVTARTQRADLRQQQLDRLERDHREEIQNLKDQHETAELKIDRDGRRRCKDEKDILQSSIDELTETIAQLQEQLANLSKPSSVWNFFGRTTPDSEKQLEILNLKQEIVHLQNEVESKYDDLDAHIETEKDLRIERKKNQVLSAMLETCSAERDSFERQLAASRVGDPLDSGNISSPSNLAIVSGRDPQIIRLKKENKRLLEDCDNIRITSQTKQAFELTRAQETISNQQRKLDSLTKNIFVLQTQLDTHLLQHNDDDAETQMQLGTTADEGDREQQEIVLKPDTTAETHPDFHTERPAEGNSDSKAGVKTLQAEIGHLKKEVEKQKDNINKLKIQNTTFQKKLNKERIDNQAQHAELNRQLNIYKTQRERTADQKTQDLRTLTSENERLRETLSTHMKTVMENKEAEKQKKKDQAMISTQSAHISNLEAQLKQRDNLLTRNSSNATRFDQIRITEALQVKISSLESTLQKLQIDHGQQIKQAKDENTRLSLAIDNASITVRVKNNEVKLLTDALESDDQKQMIERLKIMEQRMLVMNDMLFEMQREQDLLSTQLTDCRIELAKAQNTSASLAVDQAEHKALLSQVATMQEHKVVLGIMLNEDQANINNLKARLTHDTAKLQQELKLQKSQLEDFQRNGVVEGGEDLERRHQRLVDDLDPDELRIWRPRSLTSLATDRDERLLLQNSRFSADQALRLGGDEEDGLKLLLGRGNRSLSSLALDRDEF